MHCVSSIYIAMSLCKADCQQPSSPVVAFLCVCVLALRTPRSKSMVVRNILMVIVLLDGGFPR